MTLGGRRITVAASIVVTLGLAALLATCAAGPRVGSDLAGGGSTAVPTAAESEPDSDGATAVLFIGDSYAAGDGLTDRVDAWPWLVASALGWTATNVAIGGAGYATDTPLGYGSYPEQAVSASGGFDLVVVSGGRNDDPGDYVPGVPDFFATLRATFPEASIVAIEPAWDASPYPDHLARMSVLVAAEVAAVDGTYVETGHVLAGRSDLIQADGTHPNEEGHRALANSTVSALQALGYALP
ncbi:SGNH/GDSL hydrolase family protein [Demequina sp. NBRC 110052]|uniref:SGNH/GDSL hydrolase family protein n=1 Tax=Demequina sp. NBRC 110052 TaxID=1570341 RepID=UPI0013566E52|nr:SGNH/GDSL hydrolase family protein [Demequina sp. NBRC 110052]